MRDIKRREIKLEARINLNNRERRRRSSDRSPRYKVCEVMQEDNIEQLQKILDKAEIKYEKGVKWDFLISKADKLTIIKVFQPHERNKLDLQQIMRMIKMREVEIYVYRGGELTEELKRELEIGSKLEREEESRMVRTPRMSKEQKIEVNCKKFEEEMERIGVKWERYEKGAIRGYIKLDKIGDSYIFIMIRRLQR